MKYLFFKFALVLILFYGCGEKKEIHTNKPVDLQAHKNIFNIDVNNYDQYIETIKPGQNITEILSKFNIDNIYLITEKINKVFPVTQFNFGHDYYVYTAKDSLQKVKYFIYEINKKDFLVVDLNDTVKIYKDTKEVTYREHAVTGIIDYSLFTTINKLSLSDELAFKLSDIFGWQIDFYALQKGDHFSVIFEEEYIGDKLVDIGVVKAAYFNHNNKEYYGFSFEVDNKIEYYDKEGNSLRRAFLKAPLKFTRISSTFTNARLHPVLKIYRPHTGIDYAAPVGTPVQAVGDGIVIEAAYKGGAGNYVRIKHPNGYMSGYMHLSKYGKGIKSGATVKQGDIIGYVGSTGLSTGPHLDFRFWKNNTPLNYLKIEFPSSMPIDKKYRNDFGKIKDSLIKKLELLDKPANYSAKL
jgi:murein DD-endopeptidase MepM/ murein hydrolase activator NlpD